MLYRVFRLQPNYRFKPCMWSCHQTMPWSVAESKGDVEKCVLPISDTWWHDRYAVTWVDFADIRRLKWMVNSGYTELGKCLLHTPGELYLLAQSDLILLILPSSCDSRWKLKAKDQRRVAIWSTGHFSDQAATTKVPPVQQPGQKGVVSPSNLRTSVCENYRQYSDIENSIHGAWQAMRNEPREWRWYWRRWDFLQMPVNGVYILVWIYWTTH